MLKMGKEKYIEFVQNIELELCPLGSIFSAYCIGCILSYGKGFCYVIVVNSYLTTRVQTGFNVGFVDRWLNLHRAENILN